MAADVFDSDSWYDPVSAAWIIPVTLENDDFGPRCGEYRFQVTKNRISYDLYRR